MMHAKSMKDVNVRSWNRSLRQLRIRINLVKVLDGWAMPFFCAGTLAAFFVYMFRRYDFSFYYGFYLGVFLFAVSLVYVFFKVRGGFFTEKDARAFLDEQLGLYGVLSASAEFGDIELPSKKTGFRGAYRWCSLKSPAWLASGVVMVVLGCVLPVSRFSALADVPVSLPPAIAQVEQLLELLEEEENIDEESLDRFKEDLAEFMKKEREDMYTHSSLEAADAMRGQVESAVMEFARDLEQLNASLGEFDLESGTGLENMPKDLADALSSLENALLNADGQLARDLASLDLDGLRQLTPEQIREIQQRLKGMGKFMQEMCGEGRILDPDSDEFKLAEGMLPGEGAGLGPGQGGVGRGRGDAPLSFTEEAAPDISGVQEKVDNDDLSRAAFSDLKGVSQSEHEIDPDLEYKVQSSIRAAHAADGGDAVWKDNVSITEREALRNIFN